MQFHKSPLVLVGALLAVASVGLTGTRNEVQAGQRNPGIPFQDADHDGVDNALEVRLGSNPFVANTDSDGLDDLTELVLGTSIHEPTLRSTLGSVQPRARLEAYQINGTFVLQGLMLREQGVQSVHFYVATPDPVDAYAPPHTQRLGVAAFSKYVDRNTVLPSSVPNYEISSLRLVLPAAPLVQAGNFAIAIVAVLDNGIKVADQVRFTTVDGMLHEWRDHGQPNAISSGHTGGGGTSHGSGNTGGLFPADPTANVPLGENLSNQVCVQEIGAIGLMGVGVVFGVNSAECDTMFGAVCLASCTLSVGDTVVALDLPSLLQ